MSFSCWLQGGKHAQGCGSNKWLFSCCISENDIIQSGLDIGKVRNPEYIIQEKRVRPPSTKLKIKFPKKNILRRRTDDGSYHQVRI